MTRTGRVLLRKPKRYNERSVLEQHRREGTLKPRGRPQKKKRGQSRQSVSQPTAGPSTAEQGGGNEEALAPAPLEKSPHGPSGPSDEESMGHEDITLGPESGALTSQELVLPSRAGPSTAKQQGEIDNALTSGPSEKSPHRPSGPNDEELINQEDIKTEPVYGDLSSQELQEQPGKLVIIPYEDDSELDSSTIVLPVIKPSTPKMTITVTRFTSDNDVLAERLGGPSVSGGDEPGPSSLHWEHEEYDSTHLKVRADNDPMSDSESPVLRQPFAASTPAASGSAPAIHIEQNVFPESLDALERSSQEFDPEIEEGILEASFDERLKRLNNAGGYAASESQPAPDTMTAAVSEDVREALVVLLKGCLPDVWTFRFHGDRLLVELMGRNPLRSVVQRAVNLACDGGDLTVQVHMETLPKTHPFYKTDFLKPLVPLTPATVKEFADVVKSAIYAVHSFNICIGVDLPDCIDEWHKHPDCVLDSNQFEEKRYDRTLRTKACHFLVSRRHKRCSSCHSYLEALKKRSKRQDPEGTVHPNTRNDLLTPRRLKRKLEEKERTIRAQEVTLSRMRQRLDNMVGQESVPVDEELSADLKNTFDKAPDFVRIFWEQQLKAHTVKGASGMKWHPLMIRWALHIKSNSSAAFRAMRDSGFIKLPSERTLYEYSHANPATEGIQHSVLKRLSEDVRGCKSDFFTYYTLKMDEMYVFQNVVYNKGSGEIVGYASLESVEEEIRLLEMELDNKTQEGTRPVAKTMLTYMAKCISSSSKGIVACYPTATLTRDYLHSRTWDVIEACELAAVKILGIVGDGHGSNHAFFNMHTPLHPALPSGVVYQTLNVFTDDRPIFFFTDLSHVLKTIRNCFANSGAHRRSRMLVKNREFITWQTIIACYKSEQPDGLRYLHKLTAQNVFLNSYSVMKVSLAARVLSKSVALYIRDILKLNRPETVEFILYVNDWFDCQNGKYYGQDKREKNDNLAAYTDENDERFTFILSFVDYLDKWKREVAELNIPDNEKQKRLLSAQTLHGIERTSHAFVAATKYLLSKRRTNPDGSKEGYILGRTYQQDEEEQYFSRQRGMGGGNTNPSVAQFLEHQNTIEVQGNLGMRRSRGNTEETGEKVDVNKPVTKRRKVNRQLDLTDS